MKVTGSYPTLVRGVSQQAPHDRRPGQQQEQVNTLPDPVRGLVRRWGSQFQTERLIGAYSGGYAIDAQNFRAYPYTSQGKDYVLLYRVAAAPVGSAIPPLVLYNKSDNVFVPYGGYKETGDAGLLFNAMTTYGISAVTAVGKYLFIAANGYASSTVATAQHALTANQCAIAIRGGAYARKFSVTYKRVGGSIGGTVTYTTPTASYPGTLNTASVPIEVPDHAGGTTAHIEAYRPIEVPSTITSPPTGAVYYASPVYWALNPTSITVRRGTTLLTNVYPGVLTSGANQYSWSASDPQNIFLPYNVAYDDAGVDVIIEYTTIKTTPNVNYTKQVNDITSAYNQAVTQWIGTAGAAVQPEAIAEQLRLLLAAADPLLTITRVGATLVAANALVFDADDNGDGSLVAVADAVVTDTTELTPHHYYGKVVKVQPSGSAESYYMEARLSDNTLPLGSYVGPVTWFEGAGVKYGQQDALLAAVVNAGELQVYNTNAYARTGYVPPQMSASTVGDADTSPPPTFAGSTIDYLSVFQDRLVVGSRGTLTFSATGDYLNFFRSTVLTLPASDAFEMAPPGNDDDVIRYSQLYDRNLVLFGEKRQYVVSGRVPITPTSANMQVMSAHVGAGDTQPVAAGGIIFYPKRGDTSSSVWQLVPGDSADNPRSFSASSQLDDYIAGRAIELVSVAKPAMLLLRTQEAPNTVYAFSYLDDQEGRKQDAWHTLTYNTMLGSIAGVTPHTDGALLFTFRVANSNLYVVADYQPMHTRLSQRPYLDSNRAYSALSVGSLRATTTGAVSAAYDTTVTHLLLGDALPDAGDLVASFGTASLYAGYDYDSFVTLTNPYVRDTQDKAINTGNLTVTKLVVGLADTAGYTTQINDVATHYTGVYVDDELVGLGLVALTDRVVTLPIGRNNKDYSFTLRADRWYPLNITGVSYTGQYFNRATRI